MTKHKLIKQPPEVKILMILNYLVHRKQISKNRELKGKSCTVIHQKT